jgi:hypothetical protein
VRGCAWWYESESERGRGKRGWFVRSPGRGLGGEFGVGMGRVGVGYQDENEDHDGISSRYEEEVTSYRGISVVGCRG